MYVALFSGFQWLIFTRAYGWRLRPTSVSSSLVPTRAVGTPEICSSDLLHPYTASIHPGGDSNVQQAGDRKQQRTKTGDSRLESSQTFCPFSIHSITVIMFGLYDSDCRPLPLNQQSSPASPFRYNSFESVASTTYFAKAYMRAGRL